MGTARTEALRQDEERMEGLLCTRSIWKRRIEQIEEWAGLDQRELVKSYVGFFH